MIVRFRHAGLGRFFKTGSVARIQPAHRRRLRLILTALNTARAPRDMGLPGLDLHPLKGEMKGFWSVTVSGSWRVIFRFDENNVTDVDYLDYH
jgi:proteic killer suppression protein